MKNRVKTIEAVPTKNIYKSIIADYSLNLAICELIDNAIDIFRKKGLENLLIDIDIDINRSKIIIADNAGGVPLESLVYLVSPGQSENTPDDDTIGLFGVGSKRAVVALAETIKIKSRFNSMATYQIEYDDDWLKEDDWELDVYEVDKIEEGHTIIELSTLRFTIDKDAINSLKEHLSEVYNIFLKTQNIEILLNSKKIIGKEIVKWSYPGEFAPIKIISQIPIKGMKDLDVNITVGFADKSDPHGQFGITMYCNKRLVKKFDTSKIIGYESGKFGNPHPTISTVHCIIDLSGPASMMPWNSSKSEIDYNHEVFLKIKELYLSPVSTYTKTSRAWQSEWQEQIFDYKSGDIKEIHVDSSSEIKHSLPDTPRSRVNYVDKIKAQNKKLENSKPYTKGIHEAISIIPNIKKFKISTKGRIALIVLDSTLEIAFKNYLVYESGNYYSNKNLQNIFAQRHLVDTEIKRYITSGIDWTRLKYFHNQRNLLTHQSADINISDSEIENFENNVKQTISILFGSDFSV